MSSPPSLSLSFSLLPFLFCRPLTRSCLVLIWRLSLSRTQYRYTCSPSRENESTSPGWPRRVHDTIVAPHQAASSKHQASRSKQQAASKTYRTKPMGTVVRHHRRQRHHNHHRTISYHATTKRVKSQDQEKGLPAETSRGADTCV